MMRTPEYEIYHKRVVEALVKKTDESYRHMWDIECEYLQEFEDGEDPEIVAQANIDAMEP